MSTSHRFAATGLLAAAAATVGIGLATSAPASADTGLVTHRIEHSVATPKSAQDVRAEVAKIVKRVVATLHAKPCKQTPTPAE